MSKRFLDYDDYTQTTTYFEGNGDGSFQIIQQQDVNGILEQNKRLANDPNYKKANYKSGWNHCATIPLTILHEIMIKYNLDWTKKDHITKILKVVQSDYPRLMAVDRIFVKRGSTLPA